MAADAPDAAASKQETLAAKAAFMAGHYFDDHKECGCLRP